MYDRRLLVAEHSTLPVGPEFATVFGTCDMYKNILRFPVKEQTKTFLFGRSFNN